MEHEGREEHTYNIKESLVLMVRPQLGFFQKWCLPIAIVMLSSLSSLIMHLISRLSAEGSWAARREAWGRPHHRALGGIAGTVKARREEGGWRF